MANFFVHANGTVPMSHTKLPARYEGFILPHGITSTATDPGFGSIIVQELQLPFCHIRLIAFELLQGLHFQMSLPEGWLHSMHSLKNAIKCEGKWFRQVYMQQAEFVLFQTSNEKIELDLRNQGSYQLLNISWKENSIGEFAHNFRSLIPLNNQRGVKREFLLNQNPRTIAPFSIGLSHTAGSKRMNETPDALFFHQVKGYLLAMLAAVEKPQTKAIHPNDKEVMANLEECIRKYPERKYFMADLASSLHMNEKKINKVFTGLYGLSVFEYHLKCRMEKAHYLLQETGMTTKEVSLKIGYSSNPSFIRQFLEYFDYPPSRIQGSR